MTGAAPNVQHDPRWHAFNRDGFVCSCGQRHVGLFALNMLSPAGWQGSEQYEPDDALRLDGSFISENYCVYEGKSFAIRMRLPIGIAGAEPAAFMYTVWAAVQRPEFEKYVAAKKAGRLVEGAQAPATLVTRLAGYDDTHHLTGVAFQQTDGYPPVLLIVGPQRHNKSDHKLISDQRDGIGVDTVLQLFAAYNHDMRVAAAAANI